MTVQFSEGEVKQLNVSLEPIPIAPATLMGTVVDADTGIPISGVFVQILTIASTTTATNGTYSIVNIPPGSYTVRFSHADYETVEY